MFPMEIPYGQDRAKASVQNERSLDANKASLADFLENKADSVPPHGTNTFLENANDKHKTTQLVMNATVLSSR